MTSIPGPSRQELLVGVEGLALLRLLYDDAAADARSARLAEVRSLVGADAPANEGLGTEYDISGGYENWAETYDRPLRLLWIEEPPMRRRLDGLRRGTVLDAACGTGRYAAYLAARGHGVVGVDQSEAMLEHARAKLPDHRFVEGTLDAIPLEDDAVDAAVCAVALVHVADLGPVFGELARVVRPGGRVIISDVHPFLVLLGWQARFPVGDGRGFMRLHAHLPSHYVEAATAAGMDVLGCEEPPLTDQSVTTPAADAIPDANRAAYVGLPGVIVWELATG